jgi:hypothetical protein
MRPTLQPIHFHKCHTKLHEEQDLRNSDVLVADLRLINTDGEARGP